MDIHVNIGNNRLLKDQVYEALKNQIIVGNLKPGDQLNILELASMMKISSAPIREALNMLAKDGFVDMAPHRRAVVAEMSQQDWRIILDMRILLEPYAARIAAHRIPTQRIDELRLQLERVILNPRNINDYIESDRAIHASIHEYNGSKTLSDTLVNLKDLTMRVRYYSDDVNDAKRERITIKATEEHMVLLDAFAARDGDAAAKAAHNHLTQYMNRAKKSV